MESLYKRYFLEWSRNAAVPVRLSVGRGPVEQYAAAHDYIWVAAVAMERIIISVHKIWLLFTSFFQSCLGECGVCAAAIARWHVAGRHSIPALFGSIPFKWTSSRRRQAIYFLHTIDSTISVSGIICKWFVPWLIIMIIPSSFSSLYLPYIAC